MFYLITIITSVYLLSIIIDWGARKLFLIGYISLSLVRAIKVLFWVFISISSYCLLPSDLGELLSAAYAVIAFLTLIDKSSGQILS